jgi:DNA-directed RNA polymerase subunit F
MKGNILDQETMTLAQVKKRLEDIQEKEGELNFRAGKTLEYLQQFSQHSSKETDELVQKLEKLNIPRLKQAHIYKLIDVQPVNGKDVKLILQGSTLTLTTENANKIAKALQ